MVERMRNLQVGTFSGEMVGRKFFRTHRPCY